MVWWCATDATHLPDSHASSVAPLSRRIRWPRVPPRACVLSDVPHSLMCVRIEVMFCTRSAGLMLLCTAPDHARPRIPCPPPLRSTRARLNLKG